MENRQQRVTFIVAGALVAWAITAWVYISMAQRARTAADEPQLTIATQAAHAYVGGVAASAITGGRRINPASSDSTWTAIVNASGGVLASNATYTPPVPAGAIDYAKFYHTDELTWTLPDGAQDAAVVQAANGKSTAYIVSARSLSQYNRRQHTYLATAIVVGLVILAVAGAALFI